MCTVTFMASKYGFYLTANKDEPAKRGKTITLQKYAAQDGDEILHQQDPHAGGSWMAVTNRIQMEAVANAS